jgi:hypothetical protein
VMPHTLSLEAIPGLSSAGRVMNTPFPALPSGVDQ